MNVKGKYKVLDLFSGAGGMSEGFLQAGFSVPCATDYSKEASETYINRHKQLGLKLNFYNGDIRDLSRKRKKLNDLIGETEIDVITGGPPCQGFSVSGKRLTDDIRNTLFLEYLRVVKRVKPKYFVMENVEGLLSYRFEKIKGLDGEEYIDTRPQDIISNEALKMGYFVKWEVLNAKNFGVPQSRPRVIFLGHRIRRYRGGKYKDLVSPPNFPLPLSGKVTTEDAISDLAFINNGEIRTEYNEKFGNKSNYQICLKRGQTLGVKGKSIEANSLLNHQTSSHGEVTIQRFKMLKPGETVGEMLSRLDENLLEQFSTKKFRCAKLKNDEVSPTVLTLPDDIVHYESPRILTVRELARLQSFDDSFEFLGKRTTGGDRRKYETPQYTQVGNAVPPFFAKAIALEVMNSLLLTDSLASNNEV